MLDLIDCLPGPEKILLDSNDFVLLGLQQFSLDQVNLLPDYSQGFTRLSARFTCENNVFDRSSALCARSHDLKPITTVRHSSLLGRSLRWSLGKTGLS